VERARHERPCHLEAGRLVSRGARSGVAAGNGIETGSGITIWVSAGFSSSTRFTLMRLPATRSTRDSILFRRFDRTQRST